MQSVGKRIDGGKLLGLGTLASAPLDKVSERRREKRKDLLYCLLPSQPTSAIAPSIPLNGIDRREILS